MPDKPKPEIVYPFEWEKVVRALNRLLSVYKLRLRYARYPEAGDAVMIWLEPAPPKGIEKYIPPKGTETSRKKGG